MGLEASVTKVADLNEAWPLGTDPRSDGDNHIRNLKVAVKSLVSDPSQVTPKFADSETPAGLSMGGATIGTLAHVPNPVASFVVFRENTVMRPYLDYVLDGTTITLTVPISEIMTQTDEITSFRPEMVWCFYRY
ncbi:MAG TPA: hypothetical protein VF077_00370 [Nitrospiraceae bacterium]